MTICFDLIGQQDFLKVYKAQARLSPVGVGRVPFISPAVQLSLKMNMATDMHPLVYIEYTPKPDCTVLAQLPSSTDHEVIPVRA
jgi:hypothetical protein